MSMLNLGKKTTAIDYLVESKADYVNFKNTVGANLAARYASVRKLLKTPYNDFYYWIKQFKISSELATANLDKQLSAIENKQQQNKATRDKLSNEAAIVAENEYWNVYHITSLEASQKYGRDTKWCITGVIGNGEMWWNDHKEKGGDFYFLIVKNKEDYIANGLESKFAIEIRKEAGTYAIYNQQNDPVYDLDEIPNFEGISIPGVDFTKLTVTSDYDEEGQCINCGALVSLDEICESPDGEPFCEKCMEEECFLCFGCYNDFFKKDGVVLPGGDPEFDLVCPQCSANLPKASNANLAMTEELQLYEEMWKLTEAKADTQRLIDFAGEDLANRFIAVKNKLKAPENDLYYWIKNKTVQDLEAVVSSAENAKSKTQIKKDIADEGAELVCETSHWKVYKITTFAASQKYGRDTNWCITGINDYGDKYWNQYTERGIKFYFLITKGTYDPRGDESKFALAFSDKYTCEVFNQQDDQVTLDDIPNIDEVEIPGIDLESVQSSVYYCEDCGESVDEEDYWIGPDGETYCEYCFHENCFTCFDCNETYYLSCGNEFDGCMYCDSCFEDNFTVCEECGVIDHNDDVRVIDDMYVCQDCYKHLTEDDEKAISEERASYSIGNGNKERSGTQVRHDKALEEILEFINGLTQEEKDKVSMSWSWDAEEPGDMGDDIIVSILALDEVEDPDYELTVYGNWEEAVELVRKALGRPEPLDDGYDNLDDPSDTGYHIVVNGTSKKAENHSLPVRKALDEILAFINKLTEAEKKEVKLSWRCASSGFDPDLDDFMDGYEGELIVSVYGDTELAAVEFASEEERLKEKTGANYFFAEKLIRQALGLPTSVHEAISTNFAEEFDTYNSMWDKEAAEGRRFRVVMIVDDEEYTYGTYESQHKANEVAMYVRNERGVETYVEEI